MEETRTRGERRWRLGVVSYLNAKPLIAGLGADTQLDLVYDVPARLPALLDQGKVDAALVPVIDLVAPQRAWQIVSDACIGCDGETFTVRVFSRIPAESVRKLHIDAESHTSVALAGIIWQELYETQLETVPFAGNETLDECEAILLIGDKVVANTPVDFGIQTDLGSAWKSLTDLPFVFAVWAAPRAAEVGELAERLSRAKNEGVATAELIAADLGPAMGWPVPLAKRYLTTRLTFTLGQRQRQGMAKFIELARAHRIVPYGRELVFA